MRALVLVATAAVFAFAAAPSLDTAKSNMTQMADKKIAVLQEFKECVSKAADTAGIKQCRQAEQGKMKGIKDEAKAQRKGTGQGAGMDPGMNHGAGGMPGGK